jgi:phenol 2-monooxygenase
MTGPERPRPLSSSLLTRFGIKVDVVDERADKTSVGRADGLQPKTIETLRMLRLGDELLRVGTKVFDICMWRAGVGEEPTRVGRQIHYPNVVVDVLHPFLLLCHQGMVEGIFIDDLRKRGVDVKRSHQFESYSMPSDGGAGPLKINCRWNVTQTPRILFADYLVGCDGARSRVRKSIPGTFAAGTSHNSVWGVLDGEIDTDFPDIWSKTVIYSEEHGSILIVPRERNMTRFYIEMKTTASSHGLGQQYVMERAQQILAPFRVRWRAVEWFGRYQVAQRVAARFSDPHGRAFIAGDASHTHSPKASQGMNTSMHDAWNLGWKLNLAVRGLSKPVLLESYEVERKKIAHDLIGFDYEHANQIAGGDVEALAENFRTNVRFISGVGVEYGENVVNQGHEYALGAARPGCNIPPAKVSRYIDNNPVDIQLDIPILGQFKIYVFVPDITGLNEARFIQSLSKAVALETSPILRLSAAAYQSYLQKPRLPSQEDLFIRPERYTRLSHLFTFVLISKLPWPPCPRSSIPTRSRPCRMG